MKAVMISCRGREVERNITLEELGRADVSVRVFESPCDPPSTGGIMRVSLEALRWAAKQNDDVLFLEDDLLVNDELLVQALREASLFDGITYLYLNDTPARMQAHYGRRLAGLITARAPIAPGVRRVVDPRALFGTQCVYIPQRFVSQVLRFCETLEDGKLPFDNGLWRFVRDGHAPGGVFLPHPIQHRVVKTFYHGGPVSGSQMSASFGLPLAR